MLKTTETVYLTILAVSLALWSYFVGTLNPIELDQKATKAASVLAQLEEIRDGSQNGIHRH